MISDMNLQENIDRIQSMMGIINEDSNMKKMIFDIINDHVNGVDTYYNNGSIWFIFTDDKKWVIELNGGNLWYNYSFFNDIFKYLSLEAAENQHYITEWVEDTIKNKVRTIFSRSETNPGRIEDTIKNGVKKTTGAPPRLIKKVEDTIQNGIKIGDIKND